MFEVIATCDEVGSRAKELAQQLGSNEVYTSYREMLRKSRLDAVDICLPHDLHAPAAVAALESGKHVIVEKPIATSLRDADRMISASRKAGKTLMVALNQRYDPANEKIKQMIDSGKLGKLLCIRVDHNQNVLIPSDHWIRSQDRLGGGVLIGSGIHRVDLLRWFGGEVGMVSSFSAHQPDRMEGEVASIVSVNFHSGAVGEVTAIWAVRRSPWYEGVWVYGTEGSIYRINDLFWDGPEGYVKLEVSEGDTFARELSHFGQCILSGETSLTSGDEARRSLEIVIAAYRSVNEGRMVTLPIE
jgi:predicted dehydrogenase